MMNLDWEQDLKYCFSAESTSFETLTAHSIHRKKKHLIYNYLQNQFEFIHSCLSLFLKISFVLKH